MRILHTSDWHLGQNFYGKSRASEHKKFLHWLLEQVEAYQVDAIIVSGDVFDTGVPPSYAREIYFDFISRCHQAQCQLIVLAGNHDSPAMLGESKQVLASLSTQVIPLVSDNITEQVFLVESKYKASSVVVCAIPFIRPRDLITSRAGESAQDKQANLQNGISQHYQALYEEAQRIAQTHSPALPIIATGHLTAVGAKTTDSVRDIYIGTLDAFPAQAFPPADYIALGHIHQAQKVAQSEVIRYSGSPIPLSFDEAKQDKKVLLVDLNNELNEAPQVDVTELIVPRFQALTVLKTQLESLTEAVDELLHKLPEGETLWLDIEIESHDYLADVTSRINEMMKSKPVEVLVVRRSKAARQSMNKQQKKVTLNELSLQDVFDARLALEAWDDKADLKANVRGLFKEISTEVELSKAAEPVAETSDIAKEASSAPFKLEGEKR